MSKILPALALAAVLAAAGVWLLLPPHLRLDVLLKAQTALPRVDDFVVRTVEGNRLRLAEVGAGKYLVVVFLGTSCPVSNNYIPTLNRLAAAYAPKGVTFLGLNPLDHDSYAEVADQFRQFAVALPVAKDWGGHIARQAGATRTAEAVILGGDGRVYYRGRIDDQYDVATSRPAATVHDLADALDHLLAGEPAGTPAREASGCLIPRDDEAWLQKPVDYRHDVAKILAAHCIACHHDGGVAPFALTDYPTAAAWRYMIEEVVAERRMPPWHADPRYGHFRNDRSLTEDEIHTMRAWAAQGAPEGDGEAPPPPVFPKRTETWQVGAPDLVVTTLQTKIGAQGNSFFVPSYIRGKVAADTWIQAVEIRPGAPTNVHHVTVYIIPPGAKTPVDWDSWGFFAAFAAGNEVVRFPADGGKFIPAGSTIMVELHYKPTGREAVDRTDLAFYAAKAPPPHEVRTYGVRNRTFTLPAGAHHITVDAHHRFRNEVMVTGLFPHAHYRGKAFRVVAAYPDGTRETLLNVPGFDFNWQHYYELVEAKHLPRGTDVECHAIYDNSTDNPANPDPKATVRWGTRSEQEMMFCYVDYTVVGAPVSEGQGEGEDFGPEWKSVP